MQKQSVKVLTRLLSQTFDAVLKTEEKALSNRRHGTLTISEIHTIDAIGSLGEKQLRNMSAVAQELNIAVATLTVAIDKLEKKGFVLRTKTEQDRRVVLISLTKTGRIVFREHKLYHENMIKITLGDLLNPQEENALILALSKLNEHFNKANLVK